MSKYIDNLSPLAMGFAFASICTGAFGSVILSAYGSTMENTFFIFGIFFFLIFSLAAVILHNMKDSNESKEQKGKEKNHGEI